MWHAERRLIDMVSYQGRDGYIMDLEFASFVFGVG